ncbi:hypothetical protein C2E23DRAFT_260052 [Lenzites betulinus]|nr:hypothetical protein C2E23DRAFT_260052 [Lenzites betulinus]
MAVPAKRLVYMGVPATRSEKDESFEERRYLDYLKAYQTTGKPPPPCPATPTDPQQRTALGLPPLFEPLIEDEALPNGTTSTPISAAPSGATPNLLAQGFVSTKVQEYGSDTLFENIVAQPEYAKWSPEELRAEAYKAGKKFADVPPPQRRVVIPTAPQAMTDSLQSINSMPPYDQHSFEELRLAFVRAGRPLTSPEIIAQNAILRLTV